MASVLDGHIDDIIERLIEGETFRKIAAHYGCSISTLHSFLSSSEHSARSKTALMISAAQYANKGEDVLLNAPADKVEIMRARELAQHYRWMAGKRSPKEYGDKLELDGNMTNTHAADPVLLQTIADKINANSRKG